VFFLSGFLLAGCGNEPVKQSTPDITRVKVTGIKPELISFPIRSSGMSDPVTGTYEVELFLDKTCYRLASGFVAKAKIFPSGKELLFMLPAVAIVEADGQKGIVCSVTDTE